jgi:diguanylate cyclase (GGDEF)-like protein/PAS domain S-box-containing protein
MLANDRVPVLLVDEDETTATHLIGALRAEGSFSVDHVTTVEAAEPLLLKSRYGITLLSLSAPDFPGLPALALVQAASPNIPIILIAREGEENLALKGVHHGAVDFLIRSQIYDTVLIRSIKHAIEVRRALEFKEQMERALKWERDFSAALIDTAGCLFIVLDARGRIVRFNHTCEAISGYTSEEARGKRLWDFVIPDEEKPEAKAAFARWVAGEDPEAYDSHWVGRDHSRHLITWSSTVLKDEKGQVEFVIGTGIEITQHKAATEAARITESRYRALFEQSRDAIFITDRNNELIEANHALSELLGYENQELVGRPVESFFADPADRLMLLQELSSKRAVTDLEVKMRRKDGRVLWSLISIAERKFPDGHAPGYQGIIHDITDRKRAEERLVYNAYHDVLTGLPNRALFTDRLDRALARWRRHREHLFAVLFLDLNRFKFVNDSLGHSAGDELLKKVGEIIQDCLREEDTVARLGGDEYAVLIDRIENKSDAIAVAERVHSCLESPVHIGAQTVFTSASIGIAVAENEGERPEDLLRNADLAMYRAKAEGPGRACMYTPGMHAMAVSTMELDMELHEALRNDEFELHYQPIFNLANSRISGFEALLRWRNPKRGLLLPQEFLPLAEETGLILPIGKWVIQQACDQIAVWQQLRPGKRLPFVSLNISGKQLAQAGFVAETASVLRDKQVNPAHLMLELTETSLLQNPESCAVTITKLRSIGVRFCIDDFGTGYSSLSYLHRLPINGLKIDRSFISGLDRGEGPELVSTIVSLAHNLGIYAVAEGVETEAQLKSVRALGPKYVQGFFLSYPLEAAQAGNMVTVAA